jgi:hypothetical protein
MLHPPFQIPAIGTQHEIFGRRERDIRVQVTGQLAGDAVLSSDLARLGEIRSTQPFVGQPSLNKPLYPGDLSEYSRVLVGKNGLKPRCRRKISRHYGIGPSTKLVVSRRKPQRNPAFVLKTGN